jgi:hypothetical protein
MRPTHPVEYEREAVATAAPSPESEPDMVKYRRRLPSGADVALVATRPEPDFRDGAPFEGFKPVPEKRSGPEEMRIPPLRSAR